MFPNLGEDLRHYGGPWRQFKALLLLPRVWAIVAYRFRRWAHAARMPSILSLLLRAAGRLIAGVVEAVTHIELPPQASIGPGLFLPHAGYVIVASNATIGRHCTLTQGVSIGHRAGGTELSFASPVIGDRVYVGPGAAILGPVNVGDDVLIGANAVVINSVSSRAVVVGNPGRVISMQGSFDLIMYPSMACDAERLESLAEAKGRKPAILTTDQGKHQLD
jgi:serine O-acetyltransferase